MSPSLTHEFRNMFSNPRQINFGKIGESNDREFLFDIPREALTAHERPSNQFCWGPPLLRSGQAGDVQPDWFCLDLKRMAAKS
jgi:hypothetical protein